MSCEPCPVGGTQVGAADPHGEDVNCPGCGRTLNVPSPSPPGIWPEHRNRWPTHARLAHVGRPREARPTRRSTPVRNRADESGAFAAGLAGEEFFDIL